MKKKNIILIISISLLVIGIILFLLFRDKTKTIITLDINPSIEMSLDNKDNVINVRALNDDAKKIVNDDYKGKTLDKTLDIMIEKLKDNGFVHGHDVDVVLYVDGKLTSKDVEGHIFNTFNKRDVNPYIVSIDKITNEDKKLAKKYNMSPAKASYINSLMKGNKELSIDELLNKPVMELKEMEESGNYCDEGYTLEGDNCLKEIKRTKANPGKVCPEEYTDINNICYKEGKSIDTGKLKCRDEFILDGEDCIRTHEIDSIPDEVACTKGEKKTKLEMGLTGADAGNANEIVCVDLSKATHPVTPCEANDGTEYTIANGKCYWHRAPVIDTGCPGKQRVNGECWDDATGIYICKGHRDGQRYSNKDAICPDSIKYYDPVVISYKCEKGFELKNNRCVKEDREPPERERTCETGYELKNDRCVNKNDTKSFIDGYVCADDRARVEDKECVIYEIIDAKHN